jgi:hypothetical protein
MFLSKQNDLRGGLLRPTMYNLKGTTSVIFVAVQTPRPTLQRGCSLYIGLSGESESTPTPTGAEVTFDHIQEVACIGKMQAPTLF